MDEDGVTDQFRPFYYERNGPDGKTLNILGPFIRYRERPPYTRLTILPNIFYSSRDTPQELNNWWFIFFPFLWLGSDDLLVFPIGGKSHGMLGFDEFVMISPFYIRTKSIRNKRGEKPEVYTIRSVLWPFIAWGSDGLPNGRRKLRIAPFYGRTEDPRTGTESGFIMWPFYTYRRAGDTRAFFAFPFYGKVDTPTRTQTTIMWPIYSKERNHLTGAVDTAVWPVWRRAKGSDQIDIRRVWPAYEFHRSGFNTTEFVAWPFWRRQYIDNGAEYGKYTWVVPFYKRVRAVSRTTGLERRKTTIWPIGRFEVAADGTREVAIPVLSPFDGKSLREFSESVRPLISIYHKKVRPDGEREASAAFGLVMTRRRPGYKKVNLVGGLVGWERGPEGRFLRLLWGIRLRTGEPR